MKNKKRELPGVLHFSLFIFSGGKSGYGKKTVVTGGPCAGKTKVMKAIATEFPDTVFVSEAATLLMNGGFPVPGRHIEYSEVWQNNFQRAVLALQFALENTLLSLAQAKGARLLVCDRGILDGPAYTKDPCFYDTYQIDKEQALRRYDSVIHLETLAVSKPELYGKHGNENRYEDLPEAINLDTAIKTAWSSHPFQFIIEGVRSEDEQAKKVLEHLRMLVATNA